MTNALTDAAKPLGKAGGWAHGVSVWRLALAPGFRYGDDTAGAWAEAAMRRTLGTCGAGEGVMSDSRAGDAGELSG